MEALSEYVIGWVVHSQWVRVAPNIASKGEEVSDSVDGTREVLGVETVVGVGDDCR